MIFANALPSIASDIIEAEMRRSAATIIIICRDKA